MPSFYFRKLVRDQVLQRCLDDPKVKTHYKILDSVELKKELIAKIHEEANEIPIDTLATMKCLQRLPMCKQ